MMLYHFVNLSLCFPLMLAWWTPLDLVRGSSKLFGSSVYKQVAGIESGNFLFSPLSAETVLALLQSGAKGATGEEIRTALHLPNYQTEIEAAFKGFKQYLGRKDVYVFNSANKIYVQSGFAVKDGFKKIADDVFDSEAENVDFLQREKAADTINKWVEGRTENRIKDLVKPDTFYQETRAVLVNALHFKGNWTKQFSPAGNVDFYVDGLTPVKVLGMSGGDQNPYYENQELDAKFVEVPFEGDDVTFTIVLPNEKNGLSALESRMDEVLKTPDYTTANVHIVLPKFKSETEVDFKEVLQKLGVNTVFDRNADLTGLMESDGHLYVGDVLQKAHIDVNEKGVEASAATRVEIFSESSSLPFIVDHPFIYYIKFKGVVVFVGRVVDPTK